MKVFFTKAPPLLAVVVLCTFSFTPQIVGAINDQATGQVSHTLTKLFRESYSSERLLQHGIQSIFNMPNLSKSCSRDMDRLVTQISSIIGHPEKGQNETQIENWALQMLDAWAKVPEGILNGHVNALGDFDECLGIRAPAENSNTIIKDEITFQGKYCLVYVIPNFQTKGNAKKDESRKVTGEKTVENLLKVLSIAGNAELPLVPSIGSCLPSTCSDQEITQIVGKLLSNIKMLPVATFCSIDEPTKFGAGAIATISVLAVLAAIAILGTVADLGVKYEYLPLAYEKTTSYRVLLAFSITSNGRKFLNTKTSPNDVNCLHGIRFLSASWVVLGHTYLMGIIQPLWNIVDTFTMITSSLSILVVMNAAIVVDVFFVIGGFLVSLTLLVMIEKAKGKINVPMLYIHRYLRITPLYMIIICMGTFVFPLMGSGPYWHVAKTWAGFCERNWWKNMLYINNLPIYDTLKDPSDAPCHGMAWYLGVDMQLFLLSPFLLYPVWRWKRYGLLPLVCLTIVSIVLPGVLTYVNDFLPTSVPFGKVTNKYSQQSYTPTYMRAAPYLIGMCTGILYHSIRTRAFKLRKIVVVGAWVLAFVLGFTVLLSPQKFYDPDYVFKRGESALYVSGHRTAWSLAISWLIFACATGYGGWINEFLSWRPFVPLGRLTFAIYLVSMHLQFLFHLQYRQPIYVGNYHMVNLFFGHLVMSCIVALACTLVIEAPLMQLLKIVLPTRSPKPRNNDSTGSNNACIPPSTKRTEGRCSVSPAPSGGSQESSLNSSQRSLPQWTTSQDKLV